MYKIGDFTRLLYIVFSVQLPFVGYYPINCATTSALYRLKSPKTITKIPAVLKKTLEYFEELKDFELKVIRNKTGNVPSAKTNIITPALKKF